nr:MAG TPA: hypothetical protein [Caudoviricetes sp.]
MTIGKGFSLLYFSCFLIFISIISDEKPAFLTNSSHESSHATP